MGWGLRPLPLLLPTTLATLSLLNAESNSERQKHFYLSLRLSLIAGGESIFTSRSPLCRNALQQRRQTTRHSSYAGERRCNFAPPLSSKASAWERGERGSVARGRRRRRRARWEEAAHPPGRRPARPPRGDRTPARKEAVVGGLPAPPCGRGGGGGGGRGGELRWSGKSTEAEEAGPHCRCHMSSSTACMRDLPMR
jgi:hypothetical protein